MSKNTHSGESKNKKDAPEVEAELLALIEKWRVDLAKNIAKKNSRLSVYELNAAVQKIIDRIIFIRIAEDRGIDEENQLLLAAKTSNIYEKLIQLFAMANAKYNSGLFASVDWIDNLHIDDKVLSGIIFDLYSSDGPCEFSVLPAEILGAIYERFLGKTIRLQTAKSSAAKGAAGKKTAAHTAIIEEKPGVKKAGGVYYTPKYIVDFIVQNTVREKIKDKTPQEISGIRICDPACGSGAFLLVAYQCLLDYHLDYYTQEKNTADALKEGKIQKIPLSAKQQVKDQSYKLTLEEKQRILTHNIFGVDIDSQAIEAAKLSLYLKLLEGEGGTTAGGFRSSDKICLPPLENNIKCGNSLIGKDFLDQPNLKLTEAERTRINCFDWEQEFGQRSLRTDTDFTGLFDVIIGNPPYGADLSKPEREYLERKFNAGNTDTAALFMLHARKWTKAFGKNGFIVPKAFTYASNWQIVRYILLPDLEIIADCEKVWQTVKLEMSIYINQMNNTNDYFDYYTRNDTIIEKTGTKKRALCGDFNLILSGVSDKEAEIGLKIKHNNKTLNDFVENNRGGMFQADVSTTGSIKVLGGKQIGRYSSTFAVKGKINKSLLAGDINSFVLEDSILVQNIVAHIKNPQPHIEIIAALPPVPSKQYAILDTVNQLKNNSDLSIKFILGIVNSKLVSWYAYRFIFANAIRTMHFDSATTAKIPFPALDLSKNADKVKHDNLAELVDKMLELEEENADKAIDAAVYELYHLTKDEIAIIEAD
jgi:hypothetical protein